ncbi:uncharacterized protein [Physcomitrium patens]|uniref:Homeobox domain-containing protein n=1 Tax=Physcomitrium patens TaxID=3218 RepID=A0A2K1LB90_PHYPA|nr:homeobox-leucine zipper protein HAT5-like [Physcomitrium patens]PNR63296.1 hypothetical protein PHYPA_001721 [Physcomitrium patens]|eukprot:XP_024370524.1 homeobox-leucine zipper protein HAT5-like [Physcomitrella patens]
MSVAMAATSLGSFGGQNVILVRNDMRGSDSMLAMLTSCNPVLGFQVPRSGGGLEDAIAGCGQKRLFYPTFENSPVEETEDGDDGGDEGRVEKKRRLTFDQVRSLERNFEMENKLEPERKMQLAKELGLQPRQVAVWFQNRRARWKTKQLERDYEVLNSGYLKLKVEFETALREKDFLKAEVQRLSGKTSSQDSQGCQSPADPSQCESETTCSDKTKPDIAVSLKDHYARSSQTVDVVSSAHKLTNGDSKEMSTSSGSNSSDLLDTDSTRVSDSCYLSRIQDEQLAGYSSNQLPPESFVGPNLLHGDDAEPFCGRDVAQQVNFPVKLEDASHFQMPDIPNCIYFLPQIVSEQSVLPWWDWP